MASISRRPFFSPALAMSWRFGSPRTQIAALHASPAATLPSPRVSCLQHHRRSLCSRPRRSPHAVLGLPLDSTQEQAKLAYYRLAMQCHPDRSSSPDDAERFAEIGAAYAAITGEKQLRSGGQAEGAHGPVKPPPFSPAFPSWAYRVTDMLHRLPAQFDLWLMPSYSSVIYHHLRASELVQALHAFEEMRLEGERPTQAVYEMLIRGCTIAMCRVGPGEVPDHLTANLLKTVRELWEDMQKMQRKPDYWTYNELIRALGKAGAVPQAMSVFEEMCGSVRLLPEERALNSMYEACVLSGHYNEALEVFTEHEELRKSLWRPRYTPVSFSLLLTAAASEGADAVARLQQLPRLLQLMSGHGILPRSETCDRLLKTCLHLRQLAIAKEVVAFAKRTGQPLNPQLLQQCNAAIEADAATSVAQELQRRA